MLKCEFVGNTLVITVDMDAKPSKSGKSTNIASTGGFKATGLQLEGLPIEVSLTATVPQMWPDLVAENARIDAGTDAPKVKDALKSAAYAKFVADLARAAEQGDKPQAAAEPAKPAKATSILGRK